MPRAFASCAERRSTLAVAGNGSDLGVPCDGTRDGFHSALALIAFRAWLAGLSLLACVSYDFPSKGAASALAQLGDSGMRVAAGIRQRSNVLRGRLSAAAARRVEGRIMTCVECRI